MTVHYHLDSISSTDCGLDLDIGTKNGRKGHRVTKGCCNPRVRLFTGYYDRNVTGVDLEPAPSITFIKGPSFSYLVTLLRTNEVPRGVIDTVRTQNERVYPSLPV